MAHIGYVVVRQDFGGDQVSLVESTACVKWRPISVGSGSDRTIIRESDVWANQLPAMSWIGRGKCYVVVSLDDCKTKSRQADRAGQIRRLKVNPYETHALDHF